MDFQLNEEQLHLKKTVREFAEREIAPNVMKWDEASEFPLATVKELGKLGLMGEKNSTGDSQKKLDVWSSETVLDAFAGTGLIYGMLSEEVADLIAVPGGEDSQCER